MRTRTILRGILALALLLALAGQFVSLPGWSTPSARATPGFMSVWPNQQSVGQPVQINVDAGTFAGFTAVTVVLADTGGNTPQLTTGTANSDGSYSTTVTIPPATGGVGAIKVTGAQLGPGVTVQPFAAFKVLSQITVVPTTVAVGQPVQLTVSGTGFGKSATVSFTANGSTVVGATATTNTTGNFSNAQVSVTVPAGTSSLTIVATDTLGNTAPFNAFTLTGVTPSPTPTATATPTATGSPVPTGLTITPNVQQPGKTVTVTAPLNTFPTGQTTTVIIQFTDAGNNTSILTTTASADTTGALSTQVTLPAQAVNGRGTIIAYGGGRSPGGVLTIQSIISASPTTVAPGQVVTITGDGFAAVSGITIQVNSATVTTAGSIISDAHGHFSASVTIPSSTTLGTALISATDSSNNLSTYNDYAATYVTVSGSTPTPSVTATATPTFTATGTPPTATFTLTPTPIPSGNIVTTALFAEGYTGQAATNGKATFTEVLNILNPNPTAASATITYFVHGAAPQTVTRTLAPDSILRESVNGDVGFDKFVAAEVTSAQHLSVTRTITRISASGARLDGSTTQPVTAPATNWDFPEGYTGITFQEYLTILNPSATTAANVSVVLAPQTDSSVGARTLNLVVPPLDRATANIRALNLGNNARSVGMLVTSNVPIVAERVLYFGDGAGSGKFGSTVARGFNAPASQLRIPYASSGGSAGAGAALQPVGDQAFVTLLNPNTAGGPVQVTVSFNDAAGRGVGAPVVVAVPAGTRRTVVVNTAIGPSAAGPFSISLSATGPIMAESAQYFGGSPNTGLHPGVDFPAFSGATTDVFMSDLATLSADGASIKRSVYLYNPGTSQITISATYYGAGGQTSSGLYSVPPGGITTVNVNLDTQSTIPNGPIGAEFKISAGGSGSFIAAAVGMSIDGLSATEDIGNPS